MLTGLPGIVPWARQKKLFRGMREISYNRAAGALIRSLAAPLRIAA